MRGHVVIESLLARRVTDFDSSDSLSSLNMFPSCILHYFILSMAFGIAAESFVLLSTGLVPWSLRTYKSGQMSVGPNLLTTELPCAVSPTLLSCNISILTSITIDTISLVHRRPF